MPAIQIRHNISDEQLELLRRGGRSWVRDAMWAMIGAAVSAAVPALDAINKAYLAQNREPLSWPSLTGVIVFASTLILAVVLGLISHRDEIGVSTLVKDIRNR